MFLCAEFLWNGEERHDGWILNIVELHLVEYLDGVGQRLRYISKHLVHLFARLEPLLLRIEHARGVVKVLASGKTEQMVMCLGILLINKMSVVRAYDLDAIFLSEFNEHLICLLLQGEGLSVGADSGVFYLVSL